MTSKIHVSKQVSLCASVLFVYGSTNNIERHQEMAIIVIHVDLFSLLFKVYCYVKNLLIKSLWYNFSVLGQGTSYANPVAINTPEGF